MQLEFIVENQRLTRTDKNFVVEKSQNYLYAHFDFKTDDWNRTLNKYAIFTNDNYNDNNDNSLMVELQDNNTCLVPHTILLDSCYFKVNLVGTDSSGNFILTTNVSNVSVNKTGSTSGISPDDPQPSILAELLEKVNKSYSNFNFEYNEENGKLLLELIDNDKVVYSKEVDLPMEQVVKNVKYDNNTKILTIEWVNGQSTEIDFSKFTDTYLGDEKTIHLENNVFSIKEEWINEINNKIDEKTSLEETDERYLKKESAIIEEHEISEAFYERTTASDSTGSKYEIENGSEAKVKYLGGMTYKSENLIIIPDKPEKTENGITYSVKDGVITLNGTATQDVGVQLLFNGFNGNDVYLNTFTNDITREHHFALYTPQWETILFNYNNNTSGKVYINDGKFYHGISITIKSGDTVSNWTIKLMAVKGSTAPTEYKQGFEGLRNTAVSEIISKGANLFGIEDITETTLNGLTYSAKNGIIYLNGTSTVDNTYIKIPCKLIGAGTYTSKILEYKENGVATDTFKLAIYFRDSSDKFIVAMYDNYKKTLNITNDLGAIWLVFAKGLTYNNVSFGISIVRGTTAPTEYQPYWEESLKIPESVTSIEGYGDGLSKTDLSKTNYVDFERNKFVQNVNEITLDGTETNSTFTLRTSPYTYVQLDVTLPLNASLNDKMLSLSNSLNVDSVNIWNYENKENTFVYVSNNKIRILFSGTTYTTKEELNAYLQSNPITIHYLLETPIETDIDLVDRTYKVDNLGTETLVNEYKQKAFASIEYGVSLKSQIIENSENIANLKNDKLDKVIGSGGTDRVYGIDMSGKQIVIPVARYDMYTNTNCLARVDSNGEVKGVTTGRTKTAFTNINYVENNFETIINSNLKVQNLQKIIDKQAKRIEQLELASEGTILSTYENVSELSYNRLIGANVLPYGTLDKVGGMTYKSDNILDIDDFTTTKNGITFTYSKGHLSIKGTFESTITYMTVYFGSDKTKIYANKTYVMSISKAITKPLDLAQIAVEGTGAIMVGMTTQTFTTSKDIVLNGLNIGAVTEEEVGTSIDLEFDIWINEVEAKPFNEYFDGLRDSAVSEVISNGANLISSEFIQGGFGNDTGELVLGNYTTIVTKDYIKALPNTTYTFSINERKSCFFGEYDKDYNFLGVSTGPSKKNTITTKSNTAYIRLKVWSSEGTTLENATNRMLNYGSEVKPYKPYKAPITYSIPSQIQVLQGYGIGINETYKNYVDYNRGMFVKACNSLELNVNNTSNVQIDTDGIHINMIYLVSDAVKNAGTNIICDKINVAKKGDYKMVTRISYLNFIYIYVDKSLLSATPTTKEEAKTLVLEYFNSIGLTTAKYIYPLETPIETDISQYLTSDNIIELEALGSLTFENEYQQDVPNEITYQERNV